MHATDAQILKTKEIKNNLESYIFENRPRLDKGGILSEYVTDEDRTTFMKDANETEEWIYDESSDATYEEYEKRLKGLKMIADPAMARYRLRDDTPFNLKTFTERVRAMQTNVKDKKAVAPDHISPEEYDSAIQKCEEVIKTVEAAVADAMAKPKHLSMEFNTVIFDEKLNEASMFCNKIINKPKPKPKKVEEPAKGAEGDSTDGAAKPNENDAEEEQPAETRAAKDNGECPQPPEVLAQDSESVPKPNGK